MHHIRTPLWAGVCIAVGIVLGFLIAGSASRGQAQTPAPAKANPPALEGSAAQAAAPSTRPARTDGKLRIIAFGAHPDDCELRAAGVAAMWVAKGHHVKFVSVTNGDIGHWRDAGGPLARRRKAEVEAAAKVLGIATEVLDIHDGELMPTLENRRTIVRLIREWDADIVMGPRPNDYHPDHRYTGILVQDAAFMVSVPFFCPDVAPVRRNPVFLYYNDIFQKPQPFAPDVIVSIDGVMDTKMKALDTLVSQFYEGGALGNASMLPTDPADQQERWRQVRTTLANRNRTLADRYREALTQWYGKDRAEKVQFAEAFEVCEYGRRPTKEELAHLFPFFGE